MIIKNILMAAALTLAADNIQANPALQQSHRLTKTI